VNPQIRSTKCRAYPKTNFGVIQGRLAARSFVALPGVPFDVVFDVASNQQRVLFKESALQGTGNADLLCNRSFAPALRAVEPISSRVCSLPMMFAFFSRQACV
jgi:hypothetical protein